MADTVTERTTITGHGAKRLPTVDVDSYNVELRGDQAFLGDKANKRAFRAILDDWRRALRKRGEDPFGDESSDEISKKKLDAVMADGDPEAAGLLHGAIEDFSQELAQVIRHFLKLKAWRDTERLAIGGGFRETRVGELVIGRAAVILKAQEFRIELVPIRHDPDEAGLIGTLHLAPSWMFKGHDAIIGVDIGGTNIRAGIVITHLKRAGDLSNGSVHKLEIWRHADDKPKRDEAVERLAKLIDKLIASADKENIRLAPFIGIGCPGVIDDDGAIVRGAQNLPGNWASKGFHLPSALRALIPTIGKHETSLLMHNDAVVQGLSEVPKMQDVKRWGVLTIGTGLGNARFTNRGNGRE
jgi:predicted NBD/HSP70 family sugar kinase